MLNASVNLPHTIAGGGLPPLNMINNFPTLEKTLFALNYFSTKTLTVWYEVREPKLEMFTYGLLYSIRKFINPEENLTCPFSVTRIRTIFGDFKIRPKTDDISVMPTTFERRDINFLLKILVNLITTGKRIHFIDVGAHIGSYTVTVGNKFRGNKNIHIYSFEPLPDNFNLLKDNIRLNGLTGMVTCYPYALSDHNSRLTLRINPVSPGNSSTLEEVQSKNPVTQIIVAKTLDGILSNKIKKDDVIVVKIDVEGMEKQVLAGAEKILSHECYMVIEDLIKTDFISLLQKKRVEYLGKFTPYNSWWKMINSGSGR